MSTLRIDLPMLQRPAAGGCRGGFEGRRIEETFSALLCAHQGRCLRRGTRRLSAIACEKTEALTRGKPTVTPIIP